MTEVLAVAPALLRLAGLALATGLGWLGIALDLAPLSGDARGWPLPDLLFVVMACLVLRRAALVPAPLVFALGLVRDLLSGGAVGPATLGLLLGIEILRGHAPALRRRSFAMEWLQVGGVAVIVLGLPVGLLWLTLADVPPMSDLLARLAATVAAYPIAVALLRVGHEGPRTEAEAGRT